MNPIPKYCPAALLLCALASALWAGTPIVENYPFSPGQKLEVDLKTGGAIDIEAWDEDTVQLEYTLRAKNEDLYVIEHQETDFGIRLSLRFRIRTLKSNFGINVKLMVPRLADLDIYTSGGDLTITGIEGEIEGKTMGGAIRLKDLIGKVQLTTMGGNVRVEDSDLDGRVKTMGGNIMFHDVIGNIDGKTMGGNVVYDNVKLRERGGDGSFTPDDVVNIHTMGGEIKVEDAPFGAKLKTMGGGITVKSAGHFVDANTMGGNIEVAEVDGWVKVGTMGGDVRVNMIGDPKKGRRDVEISSKGGDIHLTLPRGISANFDIELDFTKNSKRAYKIISDFPMDQHTSDSWSYAKGTPRKASTLPAKRFTISSIACSGAAVSACFGLCQSRPKISTAQRRKGTCARGSRRPVGAVRVILTRAAETGAVGLSI